MKVLLAALVLLAACTPREQVEINNERYHWNYCHNVLQIATSHAETTYVLFVAAPKKYSYCVNYLTPVPKL